MESFGWEAFWWTFHNLGMSGQVGVNGHHEEVMCVMVRFVLAIVRGWALFLDRERVWKYLQVRD